jgi:hypothetical protein
MPIEELEEKVRRMQAVKGSQTTYLNINGTPNASQGQDGDQAIRSTTQGKLKSIKIGADWYDSVLLPSLNKVSVSSSEPNKISIQCKKIEIQGEVQELSFSQINLSLSEETPASSTAWTMSHRVKILINGTEYYLALDAV